MRKWSLKKGDPIHLVFNADANLEPTSYIDDQIWSLMLSGGNPPALTLQTTYGLRAQDFRIFPRFSDSYHSITDPEEYLKTPIIQYIETNYLKLLCSPFTGIDVKMEFWVPCSQSCCGRISLINTLDSPQSIRIDLIALLKPVDGERMASAVIENTHVLAGRTGGIYPLLFLAGGATKGTGSYPSLSTLIELAPDEEEDLIWYHAACSTLQDSYINARAIAERRLEPGIARLDVYHSGKLMIETGDMDWDAAIASSQRLAFGLAIGPSDKLPFPSFVLSRMPNQGYSMLNNGSDYDHLWKGQSPLDTYLLLKTLLPNSVSFLKGLISNFISSQDTTGLVDWKPGLSGYRSNLHATPVLSRIAWMIYEIDQDKSFLEAIFPGLLSYFHFWFDPSNDRDSDFFPEWKHPFQCSFDDHPIYSQWQPSSRGIDISTVEMPVLVSFLYQDSLSLISMSREIGREDLIPDLETIAKSLKSVVESCWDSEETRYLVRDRDSHNHPPEEQLGKRKGPGVISVKRPYRNKARLVISIHIEGLTNRKPNIIIRGRDTNGRFYTHKIKQETMKKYHDIYTTTTQNLFTYIDWIDIQGIEGEDVVIVSRAGFLFSEIAQLTPLWAGIPDLETGKRLIEGSILNPDIYLTQYGLCFCSRQDHSIDIKQCKRIDPIWNLFVIEGLIKYNFRSEAAQLFARLVNVIIKSLKEENCFREYYDAETGKGFGERNHLGGIIPVGLFIELLGLKIYSAKKIHISGHSPFPWTVTLQFKGLVIIRHQYETVIIFPDGQSVEVKQPNPTMVFLEGDQITINYQPDS
jgi:hypothetical protein